MQKLPFLPPIFKYFTLPLLAVLYPAIFHYANNARRVLFSSLVEVCIFLAGVALAIYLILLFFSRKKYPQTALGSLLIIIFFHTYGFISERLSSIDLIQVENYNFMPFWVFAAIYGAWMMNNLSIKSADQGWNALTFVIGLLIAFNLIQILPVEIEKYNESKILFDQPALAGPITTAEQSYPDIYFIIFDEGAGFEVARRYWQYDEVDEFVSFLKSEGFYVAENSHAGSRITMREIATRLNYEEYPINYEDSGVYSEPISNNRVMKYLKNLGYTTVVYQEPQYILPIEFPRLHADYLFDNPGESVDSNVGFMNDFKRLVLDNTLLRPLVINITPGLEEHKNFIFYTTDHLASPEIPSPKFVYVHFLLPHAPFLFNASGGFTAQTTHYNWQAYFGTYQYSLKIAELVVKNIFSAADPSKPPVIIIQSDHGARNLTNPPFSGYLEEYPAEYHTWIINTMYLPGCESAPLTQDLNPINTFPIVFNCYFDADIPLK